LLDIIRCDILHYN